MSFDEYRRPEGMSPQRIGDNSSKKTLCQLCLAEALTLGSFIYDTVFMVPE